MTALEEFENFLKNLTETSEVAPVYSDDPLSFYQKLCNQIKAGKFKFIIVGDNPGEQEYAEGKAEKQGYFQGPQTKYIRENFIKKWGDQVLALNKTLFFTKTTGELKNILNAERNKSDKSHTLTSQEIMANLIVALTQNKSDVHIWIVGHSHFVEKDKLDCDHFPKDKFFAPFQKILDKAVRDSNLKGRIFVFGHPSRSWFKKDIEDALHGKIPDHLTDESIQAIEKTGEEKAKKYFDI